MGLRKIIMITACIGIFLSCSYDRQNVISSRFIEEYTLAYTHDEINNDLSADNEILMIRMYEENSNYNIIINRYDKSLISSKNTEYFGYQRLHGFDVYFYGKPFKEFVTIKPSIVSKTLKCNLNDVRLMTEYDPVEFKISLFKNYAFDEMHSFRINQYENLEILRKIVKDYIPIDSSIIICNQTEDILNQVEELAFYKYGKDSLLSFINAKINTPKINGFLLTPKAVIIRFTVSSIGKVENINIIRSSGDNSLDSNVLKAARYLPDFIPAKHRGVNVNSYVTIPISLDPAPR